MKLTEFGKISLEILQLEFCKKQLAGNHILLKKDLKINILRKYLPSKSLTTKSYLKFK